MEDEEHEDAFKALFHHHKVTGHVCDVTDMAQGEFRAECSCGWWRDLPDLDFARRYAKCHIDWARTQHRLNKQRQRRVRENERRAEVGRTPWAVSA